jgi:nitroreductase
MFIENVLIAARGHGLSTCAQAAFAPYHRQIRPILGMAEEEVLVCGIALGYEDETKPENSLKTERAPLEDWVTFKG